MRLHFLVTKISCKMMMPHKLVWMDEKFMEVTSLCNFHCNLVPHIDFCD